jgi:hypothetical protein
MHTTNYCDTFIAIAPDCTASQSKVPESGNKPTVAYLTYHLIAKNPYKFTSDEVLFSVYADRQGIPAAERDAARSAFFSKGQACLRASPLGKQLGWGVHSDSLGRVAVYGVETPEYRELASGHFRGQAVKVKYAMRSQRQ